MSDLPSRCREVFEMSRFKKMKNREIADALQISTTAVEKHIWLRGRWRRRLVRPLGRGA